MVGARALRCLESLTSLLDLEIYEQCSLSNLAEDDDFEATRLEWVKFKSLAEVLQGYDAYDAEAETDALRLHRIGPSGNFINTTEQAEPRISLVAESLYDGVEELCYKHNDLPWEALQVQGKSCLRV